MGGIWEGHIRTVHSILTALFSHHGCQLDDGCLSTFFAEAQAILNCCSLTVDDQSNTEGPVPLAPCQLLTIKSSVELPTPGVFRRADLYSRKG